MAQQTYAQLQAENAQVKAALAEALTHAAKPRTVSFKVSDKGGVSVYGLGRFPVTLYKTQWILLLANAPDLAAFIEENADKLSIKA